MFTYRITRNRENPGFYHAAHQVSYHNERSMRGVVQTSNCITKIERAPVGEFEDVTAEILNVQSV